MFFVATALKTGLTLYVDMRIPVSLLCCDYEKTAKVAMLLWSPLRFFRCIFEWLGSCAAMRTEGASNGKEGEGKGAYPRFSCSRMASTSP